MTARGAALEALLQVEVNEGYSNLVLNKTLKAAGLEPRDTALVAALFYGVLERRLTLDYALQKVSKLPLASLHPVVLELLRMAAYQVRYLTKVPPSAAVDEAVKLAKETGQGKASGFVNGVLRSLLRGGETPWELPTERLKRLSVEFSCPEWLISLWEGAYGAAVTQDLLDTLSGRPPLFIRVNNTRITREALMERLETEGMRAAAVPFLENAVLLEETGSVEGSPAFQEGLYHVQDLSSQLCCAVLDPRPGERVADVCAAPGGKSFTLAERMEDRGEVLSFDQYKGKIRLISEGARRLGLSMVSAALRDAEHPEKPLPEADRVLCDAPCSGLGILRRKPEIRYKQPGTLDSLPDLQYRILYKTAELVRPGGLLVYSTCALNPKENGAVARRFLRENPAFTPVPLALPAGLGHTVEEPANEWTVFPQLCGSDGFFISTFQRKQE